jgi:lysozyme
MTLREQLIRDEGRRLKPYRDTLGILTIGVGRNLDDVGLFPDEVDLMLDNDIRVRRASLGRFEWFVALDEVRQGVLINMSFMGIPRLLAFYKMIAALEVQDYERAATEMLDSKWAGQVHARADRLAQQMRSGQWT